MCFCFLQKMHSINCVLGGARILQRLGCSLCSAVFFFALARNLSPIGTHIRMVQTFNCVQLSLNDLNDIFLEDIINLKNACSLHHHAQHATSDRLYRAYVHLCICVCVSRCNKIKDADSFFYLYQNFNERTSKIHSHTNPMCGRELSE